jgi:fluoroacetyl-CoA thioesterase
MSLVKFSEPRGERMKPTVNIPVGANATNEIEVTQEMTVAHFHAHMPAVYGTPIMIYHLENTAAAAIQNYLPDGWVTVGVVVNVKHLAATPVGATVTTRAEVIEVGDSTIKFAVEAHDGFERIGEGIHIRAAVDMERFMRRVQAKSKGRE